MYASAYKLPTSILSHFHSTQIIQNTKCNAVDFCITQAASKAMADLQQQLNDALELVQAEKGPNTLAIVAAV